MRLIILKRKSRFERVHRICAEFTKMARGIFIFLAQTSDNPRYITALSKRTTQISVMLKTTPNFAFFDPCENNGRAGEMFMPIIEALPTTKPLEYI